MGKLLYQPSQTRLTSNERSSLLFRRKIDLEETSFYALPQLVTFNSSVNVFIYIIFGEKFQKQLLQWVKGFWCCPKPGASAISVQGPVS